MEIWNVIEIICDFGVLVWLSSLGCTPPEASPRWSYFIFYLFISFFDMRNNRENYQNENSSRIKTQFLINSMCGQVCTLIQRRIQGWLQVVERDNKHFFQLPAQCAILFSLKNKTKGWKNKFINEMISYRVQLFWCKSCYLQLETVCTENEADIKV